MLCLCLQEVWSLRGANSQRWYPGGDAGMSVLQQRMLVDGAWCHCNYTTRGEEEVTVRDNCTAENCAVHRPSGGLLPYRQT